MAFFWRYFGIQVLFFSINYYVVKPVDRSNFKTCEQSGFCKFQRSKTPGQTAFKVLPETLSMQKNSLLVDLINTVENVKFELRLFGIKDSIVRFQISEKYPIKPRYHPLIGDVLISEPLKEDIIVVRSGTTIKVNLKNGRIVMIEENPFTIQILEDNELILLINSKGLLTFEHTREKAIEKKSFLNTLISWFSNSQLSENDHKEENQIENSDEKSNEEGKKENEETLESQKTNSNSSPWEETFKTHTDTKPNGPQSVGMDFSFPGFEYIYGIPEHADSFPLRSTKDTDPYRLYNLDVFEFEVNNPMALYGSVPLMYAHNEKRTVGLFWLNTAETWIDIRSNTADKNVLSKLAKFVGVGASNEVPQIDTQWMSESGLIDVFILLGPTPKDAFRQYASLTGATTLPPLFALAYHQCRWNYNDQEDVLAVNEGFDKHDIPMDVIWLDIEHTDGKRYFTWDGNKFSNSVDMINKVASKGRKMVTIVDPHLKRDDNYKIHSDCQSRNYYIKNKDGENYDGWCWPGSSSWPDFLRKEVREWWASKFLTEEYVGSTLNLFTWNDMNEPSVFNGPEITMHKDAKHVDNIEHRHVHNIYGTMVHRATFEGQMKRDPNQRPFVLTRAYFAGAQRYGAAWTGDNSADWEQLKIAIPMLLSNSIAGITFIGADVGGFFKNPDPELLTRWYQAGAYQPFFRAHAHLDTRRREPWLLEDQYKNLIREAIRRRYALLPYWYTQFYFNEKYGYPVMQPLWVEFPREKETFSIEDEYLIGPALLVRPVTDSGASGVNIFLPGGQTQIWYEIDSKTSKLGGQFIYVPVSLEKIPCFQRGGTIIPRKNRVRRSSIIAKEDPYTLTIAVDLNGEAEGDLFVDDYNSFEYRKNKFCLRKFIFKDKRLINKNNDPMSTYETKSWLEKVEIIGFKNKPSKIHVIAEDRSSKDLEFLYETSTQMLVIRKPELNVAQDWVITIF